jgi:hypothetical protein
LEYYSGTRNYIIWRRIGRTKDHHAKQIKLDSEKQISHIFSHMWNTDFLKIDKLDNVSLGERWGAARGSTVNMRGRWDLNVVIEHSVQFENHNEIL